MTTKKIVAIVVCILLALVLIVGVFVGGIMFFVFHQVSKSDAAIVARSFLKSNERLKQDIGEVTAFGWFITGNINIQNSSGTATLKLKVIGARKTVNATVDLIYRNGKDWRVTSASYTNEAGQAIELFNPYESKFKFQIPDFRSQLSDYRSQISNLKFPISNSEIDERRRESSVLV
ncbi:MAG TPA: cytochrome c oxidase assembly factor Coa1 family protein [Pyrinomonadaceae bacterium]|nr:cytochrome c oxidase assembly factor Coa1 family protein [Pyrinomonadaceae bacterium]